jgi:hypothetical protein
VDRLDPEDDEDGNAAHCRRLGIPEQVVYEVLSEEPVEIKLPVQTAEGAFVGPNRVRNQLWTVLLDTSYKRGDWLRPVTGWQATPAEIREWEQATSKRWKGADERRGAPKRTGAPGTGAAARGRGG